MNFKKNNRLTKQVEPKKVVQSYEDKFPVLCKTEKPKPVSMNFLEVVKHEDVKEEKVKLDYGWVRLYKENNETKQETEYFKEIKQEEDGIHKYADLIEDRREKDIKLWGDKSYYYDMKDIEFEEEPSQGTQSEETQELQSEDELE